MRACPYCGVTMRTDGDPNAPDRETWDHVVPKSMGGRWLQRVCRRCNLDKANAPIQGWLGRLRLRNDPRVSLVEAFIARAPWSQPVVRLRR